MDLGLSEVYTVFSPLKEVGVSSQLVTHATGTRVVWATPPVRVSGAIVAQLVPECFSDEDGAPPVADTTGANLVAVSVVLGQVLAALVVRVVLVDTVVP